MVYGDTQFFPVEHPVCVMADLEHTQVDAGDLDFGLVTAFPPGMPPNVDPQNFFTNRVQLYHTRLEENRKANVISTADELNYFVNERQQRRTAVIFGLQNSFPEISVKLMKVNHISVLGLCYDKANAFGIGCGEQNVENMAGLSIAGAQLVIEAWSARMIIDLSHAHAKTAREVLELAKHYAELNPKIMVSHTGCSFIYDHPRNLPDDVLKGVADLGGVVGIYTVPFGLDPELNTSSPFIDHIMHALSQCGRDAVCIGSDMPYVAALSSQRQQYMDIMMAKMPEAAKAFKVRAPEWMSDFKYCQPNGMEMLAEMLLRQDHVPALEEGLVEQLVGKNAYNFFMCALL